MTKDARIVSTSFHKGVVESKRAFTYELAQKLIDTKVVPEDDPDE